jgi:hypothetical protein
MSSPAAAADGWMRGGDPLQLHRRPEILPIQEDRGGATLIKAGRDDPDRTSGKSREGTLIFGGRSAAADHA